MKIMKTKKGHMDRRSRRNIDEKLIQNNARKVGVWSQFAFV